MKWVKVEKVFSQKTRYHEAAMPNGPLKTDNQIYLGNQLETE